MTEPDPRAPFLTLADELDAASAEGFNLYRALLASRMPEAADTAARIASTKRDIAERIRGVAR